MVTSRRTLIAGAASVVAVSQAPPAFAAPFDASETTVAEERFARLIAAAQAPRVGDGEAEHYAETRWRDYVAAAGAVLDARG